MRGMDAPIQLENLKKALENAKLEAAKLTAGLDDAQLWQRPPEGGWSVGECLVHLNFAGEPYAKKMQEALEVGRARGKRGQEPFRFGFLGGRFVRSLSAEGKGKFKAPKAWQPERQADVLERFLKLQDELLSLVKASEGFDLARILLTSPLSPLIRLNLFEALNLVVVHEQRHLAQAERVRQLLSVKVS